MVAASRFDLVLMDGSMLVLDGFSAAVAIRAREARDGAERVPIVALTAHVVGDGAESWQAARTPIVARVREPPDTQD